MHAVLATVQQSNELYIALCIQQQLVLQQPWDYIPSASLAYMEKTRLPNQLLQYQLRLGKENVSGRKNKVFF